MSTSEALLRTDGSPVRALVVDDEPQLADLLSMALRFEGWQVRSAGDGAAAVEAAHELRPDVVVLDVMLPDVDGLTLAGAAARGGPRRPGPVPHRPRLRRGPHRRHPRRRRRLRDQAVQPGGGHRPAAGHGPPLRCARPAADPRLAVGDLTMDEESHEVFRGGDEVALTQTEFELLRLLMRNPRKVLSKAHILDRVWKYDFGGQANVVELYISYLRKKVDAGREPMIHTVRGVGYVLKPAR